MAGSLRRLRAHQRVGRRAKDTILSSKNEGSSTPDASISPCRDKTAMRTSRRRSRRNPCRQREWNSRRQNSEPDEAEKTQSCRSWLVPSEDSQRRRTQEASEILQDNLATDHFINALEDWETRLKIRETFPKTLDTAVSQALQLEVMNKAESRRSKTRQVRKVQEPPREWSDNACLRD